MLASILSGSDAQTDVNLRQNIIQLTPKLGLGQALPLFGYRAMNFLSRVASLWVTDRGTLAKGCAGALVG